MVTNCQMCYVIYNVDKKYCLYSFMPRMLIKFF